MSEKRKTLIMELGASILGIIIPVVLVQNILSEECAITKGLFSFIWGSLGGVSGIVIVNCLKKNFAFSSLFLSVLFPVLAFLLIGILASLIKSGAFFFVWPFALIGSAWLGYHLKDILR